MKNTIIGLKELREKTENYISQVKRGKSFIVVRKSKPVFKLAPITEDDEKWETVVDFIRVKKGGVDIEDILSRL